MLLNNHLHNQHKIGVFSKLRVNIRNMTITKQELLNLFHSIKKLLYMKI